MALKIMDLFKSIKWAKNGAVTDMSQTNYEAGWSHLGDDTPTVEDFNIVQQLNDEKDQWLFNQIKAVCDAKGITVTESDVQALLKAINTSATLSMAGITQLSSAIDSTIENMAATPKAIKTLKDLIDAITRKLGNYIPNSKKSNAVNSNSADTVATSVAVKNVNDNANGRVSKAGDTMTGMLNIKNSDYAAVRTYNTAGWSARWESAPQSANHFAAIAQANNNESVVNRVLVPKKNGTILLDSDGSISGDASTYVKRDGSGDVNARLLRTTYKDEERLQGAIAFRINNSNDNYTRYCNSPAAVRGWLDLNITYQKIGNFEIRKYPDGTMIQTYVLEQRDIIPERQGNPSFNWAVAFTERPLIIGSITTSINNGHDTGINILSSSTNAKVFYYTYEHGNPNQGLCRLQFLAIGRWK